MPPAEVFDFGAISLDSVKRHTFSIKNAGNDTLSIAKIRPSCECLHILSYPCRVPPSCSAEIEVRLVPDRTGQVQHTAFLECSDANNPVRMYVMKGTVIPPKSGKRQDTPFTGLSPRLFLRPITARDQSCYITVTAVQQKLTKKEDIVLVDTRDEHAFSDMRIPGSLNIPEFALKTKSFLQTREVVLIDEGYGTSSLERNCRELRERGFRRVSILTGGLNAWWRSGGQLAGTAVSGRTALMIPPRAFFLARKYDDWLVIDATGDTPRSMAADFIPERIPVPYSGNTTAFAAGIENLLRRRPDTRSILVFDRDGQSYPQISDALARVADVNVFCLKGGRQGYAHHLRILSVIAVTKTRSTGTAQDAIKTIMTSSRRGCCY